MLTYVLLYLRLSTGIAGPGLARDTLDFFFIKRPTWELFTSKTPCLAMNE